MKGLLRTLTLGLQPRPPVGTTPADVVHYRQHFADAMRELGWTLPVAQVNHSLTRKRGAVRGLHFQHPPHAEDKYVSCLRGAVYDVAVDLRRGSPTFLRWHAQTLSAENGCSLLIPQGFAHGFQALKPESELIYLHSRAYAPEAEGGLHAADPRLAVEWPLPVGDLSARDAHHPLLDAGFSGLNVTP